MFLVLNTYDIHDTITVGIEDNLQAAMAMARAHKETRTDSYCTPYYQIEVWEKGNTDRIARYAYDHSETYGWELFSPKPKEA